MSGGKACAWRSTPRKYCGDGSRADQRSLGNRYDRVRPRLELDVDLGPAASIALSPFWLVAKLTLAPLRESPIEDDFDGGIRGKTLAKVLVELGMRACDDEHGPSHCSLTAGSWRHSWREVGHTGLVEAMLIECQDGNARNDGLCGAAGLQPVRDSDV
jgi:hypothetical protein